MKSSLAGGRARSSASLRSVRARSTLTLVGHVDEGQHRRAVGQRHRRVVDDAGRRGRSMRPEAEAHVGRGRRRRRDVGPGRPVGAEHDGRRDDRVDMRLVVERHPASAPHLGEGRVVQPQAAVGAEHRDALGESVERLALHADQRLSPALEIDPLGDVLVDVGDAALRIRVGDDAERAPVGQVPPVLARLERRLVGGEQLRPPARGNRPARAACARRAGGRGRSPPVGDLRGRPDRAARGADRRRSDRRASGRRRRSRPRSATGRACAR